MELMERIAGIEPADQAAYAACQAQLNQIAKPLGSLGKLETLLCRAAAASGTAQIDVGKKCVLVFCADNGVVAQGVAQSGSEVTGAIARSLAAGTTSVSVMAQACGADVYPVDMGMLQPVPGVMDCRLGSGTGDISLGPAMSRQTAQQAVWTGMELVRKRVEEGYRVIATGEAGIGNTTTSSAVASVLLRQPVDRVTGRGSGLSDAGLVHKQQIIARALEVNRPDPQDPLDVLAKVGGFDLAAMTGAFLGGAAFHVPVVIDGLISSVAALCAVRMCPAAGTYLLASHVSAEPAGKLLMEELGLSAPLHADMRLGEGTGAVALFPLLDLAAAVYHRAARFEQIQVEAYTPWEN